MRYSVVVVKLAGSSLPFARLALLGALLTPLLAGPLGPDCATCCPEPEREASLTPASCCGAGCPSLVQAEPETSALVNRSVAVAPTLSPALVAIGSTAPRPAPAPALQPSGSPLAPGAPVALRL